MAEPFLSEIRIMGFNWAPKGWAMCNGQFLPINQNQPLFSLLGTTYGGNGQTTFALPDLRTRTPIHVGGGHTLGEKAGSQAVTLTIAQLPEHVHVVNGTSTQAVAATNSPAPTRILAKSNFSFGWGPPNNFEVFAPEAISTVGGSQPHQNMQPFLTLTFCIALIGLFPSPN